MFFALTTAAAEEGNEAGGSGRAVPTAPGGVVGTASWYGGKFQGRKTASGEIFDTRAFTAAHRSLPFGTMVRVTNLDNGKSVVVRINDRGPFVVGRLIDVSRAAAVELDMMKTGVARVSLVVLGRPDAKPRPVYRIQAGSFRDRDNARRLKTLLAARGYSVYLETAADGCVRVHVDNVAADGLAKIREVLRGLGLGDPIVRRIN
ncbi:MAG: septal ring lytic transglycosylase RlpA family protein [Spirochaetales bacterium]|nr:septal ring lytic transglycosylase RlpA family protein [Spirochaetales bacterium]